MTQEDERGELTLKAYIDIRHEFTSLLYETCKRTLSKGLSIGDIVASFEGVKHTLFKELGGEYDAEDDTAD